MNCNCLKCEAELYLPAMGLEKRPRACVSSIHLMSNPLFLKRQSEITQGSKNISQHALRALALKGRPCSLKTFKNFFCLKVNLLSFPYFLTYTVTMVDTHLNALLKKFLLLHLHDVKNSLVEQWSWSEHRSPSHLQSHPIRRTQLAPRQKKSCSSWFQTMAELRAAPRLSIR